MTGNNNHQLAIIAVGAALTMFGIVMVTVASTMQLQEAEARGCFPIPNAPGGGGIAVNASQGRCFHP